jgi:hypothetical protein
MNNYIYLILDFNASKRYSHHWSYVNKYKTILENFKKPYEIWIPKNAHSEILFGLGKNCKTFLRSNVYGFGRKENFYNWLIVKTIELFLIRCKDLVDNDKLETIKKFVSKLYTNAPYKRIKAISNSQVAINLIFPTLDSIAFRLVERCLKRGIPIKKVSFRLGSGYKDNLKINDIEIRLRELITNFPECDIKLGYETFTHKQSLLNHGLDSTCLYWAPAPSSTKDTKNQKDLHELTLGFLGVARPNKGFVEIPKLLRSLISHNIPFTAIAQEAMYPWSEYVNTIQELKKFSRILTILPANISEQELENVFKSIDVLVLPYSTEDYYLAGSGLLFDAADLYIPTITKKGVAFEWDITEYSLGFTYNNSEDFVSNIKLLLINENNFKFKKYNSDRNLAIAAFLGIKGELYSK